jgi:hypothetical protein
MSGAQIDRLCRDWLHESYNEEVASEYTPYSLVIRAWNAVDLNNALEDLRLMLCLAFGPEQSFGTTDYYEAREKLGLPDDRAPIPDLFARAFATE